MIDIGKILCDSSSTADSWRYGKKSAPDSHGNRPLVKPLSADQRRPIVVWSTTRTCNLKCVHCYTESTSKIYEDELTFDEGKRLINDLSDFEIPSLLFSGGEPMLRERIFDLINYASLKNIRPVISTNGTLIDLETAKKIKDSGVVYVGISLDGMEEINDIFRGKAGAFKKAMAGFENLRKIDQRVGLRLTLTRQNYKDLNRIFDFIENEGINRACFYHLVYSGRGKDIWKDDLTYKESRLAMDTIIERTRDFYKRGKNINILTVDNHADGVYIYLKLKEENDPRAEEVYNMLKWNGGGKNSTGVGIGNIDFNGFVHPDQFWQDYSFGNVRERPFSEIWLDQGDQLMKGLKNKDKYIKGRCRICKFTEICCGAMRVRAFRTYNDPWAPDPQCYLSDEEIGITPGKISELENSGENFIIPEEFIG